jgi:transposase-like protein
MSRQTHAGQDASLALFACPNPDCSDFNRFDAGNLSVCEWTGKHKHIRRLYCASCGGRFSERKGTLLSYRKLPEPALVRIVKCLGHGCSIEATADICDVDPRTVEAVLAVAGPRADDHHHLRQDQLHQPLAVVELDELHGRVCETPAKKGEPQPRPAGRPPAPPRGAAAWAAAGCMWLWRA